MSHYPFPDTRRSRVLFGLFLAAMLYLARDTLLTSSVLGFVRAQVLMLAVMAGAAVVFIVYNRHAWRALVKDRRLIGLALVSAGLLLPMVGKQDWQLMYFSVLVCVWFGVFLTFFTDSNQVARTYVLIITAVGLFSLLATYVLRRLPDAGLLAVPVFTNSKDIPFYNFLLSYVSVSYDKNRNFSIFREPGVHQYFLLLGLFLNNYLVRWEKERSLWLVNLALGAVMLSTLATGGYVEMALFALLLFFDKKLYKNKYILLTLAVLLAAGAALVLRAYLEQNMLWWEIYAMFISKFSGQGTSVSDRVGSVALNLGFFLRSPLFGADIAEVLYAIENNTSSSLLMFAIFGLLGGLLHVAGWIALVWKTKRGLVAKLGLLAILFMSFNTQNLIADVFFWLLPTMALTESLRKD
ncbi:MAG: hypothetical protein Q4F17_04790 [Eubacteriales bacterium]|nr:hypothetical protein [Eubacteriales bacterium]